MGMAQEVLAGSFKERSKGREVWVPAQLLLIKMQKIFVGCGLKINKIKLIQPVNPA